MNVYEYNPTTGATKLWARCETEEQATILTELLDQEYKDDYLTRRFGTGADETSAMFIV